MAVKLNSAACRRFTDRTFQLVGLFLCLIMTVMVLTVSWQVITRFILTNPSSFSEELAGFLLIWIGLLGASYAFHTRAHLGIDLLTHKLSSNKRLLLEIAVNLLIIVFAFFILVWGGFRLVRLTFILRQISPALAIPMGYIYMVLPLSGLLIMLHSTTTIIETAQGKFPTRNPDENTGLELEE